MDVENKKTLQAWSSEDIKSCRNCVNFDRGDRQMDASGIGHCIAHPPAVSFDGQQPVTMFPMVKMMWYCGEHQRQTQ